MKKFILIPLLVIACNSESVDPDCITSKIDIFKTEACSSGASVIEYEFENQSVFAFEMGDCVADFFTLILNENCDTICMLGGFAGISECLGNDFYANSEEKSILWSN